jgi:hypothetical protein
MVKFGRGSTSWRLFTWEREPETGKVQPRILFTLYSKAEALEALGRRDETGAEQFRHLHQPGVSRQSSPTGEKF